jgi:hypothetical protein
MKRSTVLTAAFLTLFLASALQAQRWGYRDSNRYPGAGQMERATVLAHELENTAASINRQAERNNRRPDRAEARVLADLHTLEERAAHLHDQVESNRRNPRHTTNDFTALEDAFLETAESLRFIRPHGYIDRGMDRIYSLMNELGRYYGRGSGDSRRGYYGRDRYGQDPYSRHDRRDGRDPYVDGYDRDRHDDEHEDDGHGHRPPGD